MFIINVLSSLIVFFVNLICNTLWNLLDWLSIAKHINNCCIMPCLLGLSFSKCATILYSIVYLCRYATSNLGHIAKHGLWLVKVSPLFLAQTTLTFWAETYSIDGSLKGIIMVTFAETTMVSPMELREPTCHIIPLSPGLRRKKMMWQKAVKHIIIQKELNVQVNNNNNNKQQPHTLRWTAADLALNHFKENVKSCDSCFVCYKCMTLQLKPARPRFPMSSL